VVTRPVEIYGPAILAGIGVITMHVLATRKGVAA